MKYRTLAFLFCVCVGAGVLADRGLASCPDQGLAPVNPPPEDGPPFSCEAEVEGDTVLWQCPKIFWEDVKAYNECGTVGGHPGHKCLPNGNAVKERIDYKCGTVIGSCLIESHNHNATTSLQKYSLGTCGS